MNTRRLRPLFIVTIAILILALSWSFSVSAGFSAQVTAPPQPTVTGTPVGVTIVVHMDQDQINVRSGPGTIYPKIGVLLAGQEVAAKGRSISGEWILIDYPGAQAGAAWVYSPLVDPKGGALQVVEPPPTPTPLYTTTIDPTLAAQFLVTSAPTRLPTFTPPPPLAIPTFTSGGGLISMAGVPMGLLIVTLMSIGILLGLFSLVQSR